MHCNCANDQNLMKSFFLYNFEWAILVISLLSAILDLEIKLHDEIFIVPYRVIIFNEMDECQTSYSIPKKNLYNWFKKINIDFWRPFWISVIR